MQCVQPGGRHPLRCTALPHQLAQQEFVLRHGIRLALGVDDIAGLVGSGSLHVQQFTASQTVRAFGLLVLAFGEDECRLLNRPAALARAFADRPALGSAGFPGVGQPVRGIGNAEGCSVRDLPVVEYRLGDVDDLALVRVEEEFGGRHVQNGVELPLAIGLQHHIARGGLAGNDHVLFRFVPPFGCYRFEHAPRPEDGEDHHSDDRSGHHRTQGARRTFFRTGRVRLYELRNQPSLREGVGVEFVPS